MRNYQLNAVKLQKPESENYRIQHPRCIELLKREAHRPLIALAAPTGYGKTTLLGAWSHALPSEAIGWLSLDTEDNELRRLLTHLIEALPQIAEVLRNTMLAQLDEEVPIGLQSPPQKKLTAKEYNVLQGLIARKSNASIADEHSITIETVKTQCKNIYKKPRLKSRKDLLRHFADDEG